MASSLTEHEAAQLRGIIKCDGLEAAAKWLQLNTTTLLRAAVGLPLHNATCTVIQQRLSDGT